MLWRGDDDSMTHIQENREFRVGLRPGIHLKAKEIALNNRFSGKGPSSISAVVSAALSTWMNKGCPKEWFDYNDFGRSAPVQTTFRLGEPYTSKYIEIIVSRLRANTMRRAGARLSTDEASSLVGYWLDVVNNDSE